MGRVVAPNGDPGSPRQAIPAFAYAGVPRREGVSLATESATILFTDQVGSTTLSQLLSPDAAEEVRRDHFSILRHVIAEAGGTEVKNLGDGLMVVFTSAAAALACAVAMQQRVERGNRNRDFLVGLRVGLSSGEVSREKDDYFGDPVVEAARLCASAQRGQILATEIVKAMAGRHATQEFSAAADLELKGLQEPVRSVEVRWEPTVESADEVALPARLEPDDGGFSFVGRIGELGLLTDAAQGCDLGRSSPDRDGERRAGNRQDVIGIHIHSFRP